MKRYHHGYHQNQSQFFITLDVLNNMVTLQYPQVCIDRQTLYLIDLYHYEDDVIDDVIDDMIDDDDVHYCYLGVGG